MLVCELCHSISKPINDEEDTFKSFMAFNITPREPLFRIIVGSQIVVPSTILPNNDTSMTQTHDLSSHTIFRTVNYVIPPQN